MGNVTKVQPCLALLTPREARFLLEGGGNIEAVQPKKPFLIRLSEEFWGRGLYEKGDPEFHAVKLILDGWREGLEGCKRELFDSVLPEMKKTLNIGGDPEWARHYEEDPEVWFLMRFWTLFQDTPLEQVYHKILCAFIGAQRTIPPFPGAASPNELVAA